MRKSKSRAGMTLIELIIVLGIMGVLFAAVYMFFIRGSEQFHFARRQNELATSGRLALEAISDEIVWAGYMPSGGWTEDQWHPVEVAADTVFRFYADRDGNMALSNSEYRNIYIDDSTKVVHVTDDAGMDRAVGTEIVSLDFGYFDGNGNSLPEPLNENDRDAVRQVSVKITLQSTYMGDVFQMVMQTMLTPRNLGVEHTFDPLFYLPPPPDSRIVVNVDGTTGAHTPTVHQTSLLNKLDNWGFTIVELSDDELAGYEYDSSGVDLVFLRDIPGGTNSHASIAAALQAIPVPIIALDPDDAANVFDMGEGTGYSSNDPCLMYKYWFDHPIHKNVNSTNETFSIYAPLTPGRVTTLDSLYPPGPGNPLGTELVTGLMPDTVSGVSVIHQDLDSSRRVHYCAPDFKNYSSNGDKFLYNVIMWNLPVATPPPLGEEINVETFEGESPGQVSVTIWEDDLEGGVTLPDSVALYTDFETGAGGMMWLFNSTGHGEITRLSDETLRMHRTVSGGWDRNMAFTSVDLSAYNEMTDDLYITVETSKGTSESINAEDGVFLVSGEVNTDTLVSEDFGNLITSNGDLTFWGDLYARHRILSNGWGGNSTKFVTLDSRRNARYGRGRMIIELDTSSLEDGSSITVNYSMMDSGDENHNFVSSNNRGDYIGWSLGNTIDDPVEDYELFQPESKPNGEWNTYSYTFTPTGTMPPVLYVIFSHFDNYPAIEAENYDGLSFDDILITAMSNTFSLSRVGVPASAQDWQRIAIDLDDEAVANSIPFSSDFRIALSQYGMGSWSTYGLLWRSFELGVINDVYTIPGWHHEAMTTGGIDDWCLEDFSGDYAWTLHANNPGSYSNNSDCWLQSPEFSIPSGAEDAKLVFQQSRGMESAHDFGWIEVSTNGGTTWNVLEAATYNGSYDSHGAYTGTSGAVNTEIDLGSFAGQTLSLRFVFHSDGSGVSTGWKLDDFSVTGTVTGLLINSIGFKPTDAGGGWYFNQADVYLGGTALSDFAGDGETDKSSLTFMGTYSVAPPSSGDWAVIDLNEPFILPADKNLLVKIEMNQTSPTSGYSWVAATHPGATRWAVSSSSDPTLLDLDNLRPAFMIDTENEGLQYVDSDSSASSANAPLAYGSFYGDFEGIYTMADLGFGGESQWVPGGDNNDWEIGVPLFTPDVDPALIPLNENKIAGTDLTDDGYYTPDAAWNWIRSGAYPMSEAAYDSISISYDRCLRRALNDVAFIQMAFTMTDEAPTSNSDWVTVKTCDYDDEIWQNTVVPVTEFFDQAKEDGMQFYFVRFVLSAGPFAEKGGWNIDNVGFYGRNAE